MMHQAAQPEHRQSTCWEKQSHAQVCSQFEAAEPAQGRWWLRAVETASCGYCWGDETDKHGCTRCPSEQTE